MSAVRVRCDFCDRETNVTGGDFITIAGHRGVHICEFCVDVCAEILAEKRAKATAEPLDRKGLA